MAKAIHGKRYREALKLVDPKKIYPLKEAVAILKKMPKAKFDESVTLAFKLGVDPKQSDQMVRGTCPLPHGSGKKIRILVFAKGTQAQVAKDSGAEHVGFEDLIKQVQGGWTEFDVAIATPDAMQEVRKLGKVLGPRGLMPNPKTGTVTEDIAKAIKEFKAGRVEFKIDKAANVHVPFGKLSFAEQSLEENAKSVISAVLHAKPQTAKGHYVQSCTLAASMSPGIRIEIAELAVAA